MGGTRESQIELKTANGDGDAQEEMESSEASKQKRKWYQHFNKESNGDTSRWLVLFLTTIGKMGCDSLLTDKKELF